MAAWGEWSLGEVHDINWKWVETGDCFLGHILAGLDLNTEEFSALLPHFTAGTENGHNKEALELSFLIF